MLQLSVGRKTWQNYCYSLSAVLLMFIMSELLVNLF